MLGRPWAWMGIVGCVALAGVASCSSDSSDGTGGASGGDASAGTGGTSGSGGTGDQDASAGKGGSGGSSASGGSGGSSGMDAAWPDASGGSGGGASDASPDVDFTYDVSVPDGFDPDATCAETVVEAELTPLDMYIMTDKSGSMSGTRWSNVVTAIKAFVDDGASTGIGVGIQYFPVLPPPYNTGGCTNDAWCGNYGPCPDGFCRACSTTHYSTPAVGIGALPGVAPQIKASLDATTPFGGTPTGPALTGAIEYARSWATSHPGHTVAVVLATDGDPYSCSPVSIPEVSAIAAAGVNGTPSVMTFVIGVGTSKSNMNAIASAGGSGQAYFVDTGGNVTQQFVAALNDIREKTLGCEFMMPKTDAGLIDPSKVKMTFTPGGGGVARDIPRVNDATQCAGEGWYYDDNTNPTKLLLCPDLCATVQADQTGTIEISLGCLGS